MIVGIVPYIPPPPPPPDPDEDEDWKNMSLEEKMEEVKRLTDEAVWRARAFGIGSLIIGILGAIFLISQGAWLWLLGALAVGAVLALVFFR